MTAKKSGERKKENVSITLHDINIEQIEQIRAKCREKGYYKCNVSQAVRIALQGLDVDKIDVENLYKGSK